MCRDTLITYTTCKCQIMVHTICYDHVQHTLKQVDNIPCPKNLSGVYKLKTVKTECFLKNGQALGDGRIFQHGSPRTRETWEFDRDPDGVQAHWQRWQSKNRDKVGQRTDSTDGNASAGEDRMNLEADDDDSHRKRGETFKDWQEKTKNSREPKFRIAEDVNKELPAAGRKTVNHVLQKPLSDDDDTSYQKWTISEEPKIKVATNDTILWSPTPSRSFSDPMINSYQAPSTPKCRSRADSREKETFLKKKIREDRPSPTHSKEFNFNPPFTGVHTYMSGKSSSPLGSGSAYIGDDDPSSPKPKGKKPIKYDSHRPKYPTSPPDFNTSFYAGDATHGPKPLEEYNQAADAVGYDGSPGLAAMGDVSTASGFIGYGSSYGESQGVFGNYGGAESFEREKKKVRIDMDENEERGENAKELLSMPREYTGIMDEGAKEVIVDPMDIAEDLEMGY